MNFRLVGCSFRNAPVELREKLAFNESKLPETLEDLTTREGCEAVILSTCNRVELYIAKPLGDAPDAERISEFLAEHHKLQAASLRPSLYSHTDAEAVKHLFRVTASLDSLVVGEGQIAAQVRKAYEIAQKAGATGGFLNVLFPTAVRAAKRARTETGIAHGHVSVSSVAVDYVKQVFDRFDDKTILVIGAGKMGQLTLKHLKELKPKQILVTNRSPEKAAEVAVGCGGTAVPWEQLDDALAKTDIALSTTGAAEPIVSRRRFDAIAAKRHGPLVVLDIAVPRDFDPRIHDGDRVFLFNIDDLTRVKDDTLAKRLKHVPPAEAIIEQERKKFIDDWTRRKNGPLIAKLTQEFEAKRQAVLEHLFGKLNGKMSDTDRAYIEGAFRLFQNQLLHGPIDALRESSKDGTNHHLMEAVRKLFKLGD